MNEKMIKNKRNKDYLNASHLSNNNDSNFLENTGSIDDTDSFLRKSKKKKKKARKETVNGDDVCIDECDKSNILDNTDSYLPGHTGSANDTEINFKKSKKKKKKEKKVRKEKPSSDNLNADESQHNNERKFDFNDSYLVGNTDSVTDSECIFKESNSKREKKRRKEEMIKRDESDKRNSLANNDLHLVRNKGYATDTEYVLKESKKKGKRMRLDKVNRDYFQPDKNHLSNNNSSHLGNKGYVTDTECILRESKKKHKKMRKDKMNDDYLDDNNIDKSHLSHNNDSYLLEQKGSITNTESILKESKRNHKKKRKERMNNDYFEADKNYKTALSEYNESHLLGNIDSVTTNSESIEKKKKKNRSKQKTNGDYFHSDKNHLSDNNDSYFGNIGSVTDTECILKEFNKKKKKKKRKDRLNADKSDFSDNNDSHLVGYVTDSECIKKNKKKKSKDYDLDAIRRNLLNSVFKNFESTKSKSHDNSESLEDSRSNKKNKKEKRKSGDFSESINNDEGNDKELLSTKKEKRKRTYSEVDHLEVNDLLSPKKKKQKVCSNFDISKLQGELFDNEIKHIVSSKNKKSLGEEVEKCSPVKKTKKEKYRKSMSDFTMRSNETFNENVTDLLNKSPKHKKRKSKNKTF